MGLIYPRLSARNLAPLLTLIHRRVPDRDTLLSVSAGWHAHLDILVARARSTEPTPFWDDWLARKAEYAQRLPSA